GGARLAADRLRASGTADRAGQYGRNLYRPAARTDPGLHHRSVRLSGGAGGGDMGGNENTVRSYEGELSRLSNMMARMGGLAEAALDVAIQAVVRRDSDQASSVIAADAKVDELERNVHSLTLRLLALRQPVALDLRMIVGALKISGDVE